jgi:catechol 2,3-dioxygenase-like lactoylglutathione lyase family enzyme
MQFDHAAQVVPNIAEAVAWYCETIPGSRVLYQDLTWALIEAAGVRLAFVTEEQHPDHLAWRVSREDLLRLAQNYEKTVVTHRDGTEGFYLEAPGGRTVEIIWMGDIS